MDYGEDTWVPAVHHMFRMVPDEATVEEVDDAEDDDEDEEVDDGDDCDRADYQECRELLVAGQPTTTTSPPAGAGSGALSPAGGTGASTAAGPLGSVPVPGGGGGSGAGPGGGGPGGGPGGGGSSCCENGRPIMTDPVSGQTVCSCQYDSARLAALSSYPRLASTGVGVGVYGTPYPSTDQNPYPSIGVDSSAFYSPLSNPYGLKDGSSTDMTPWSSAALQPTTGYYPYDPTLAAYGYGAGYDLAARRKNATRESTATLKAWLSEHKKNPYPTKGEKIMLAIITKMTLTQVSTWFANARRRLKKENKMTWEPKNKTDDDEDAIVSDSDDCNGGKDEQEKDMRHRDEKGTFQHVKSEHHKGELDDDEEELDDLDEHKPGDMSLEMHHGSHLGHPGVGPHHMQSHMMGHMAHHAGGMMLKEELKGDCGVPIPATKPKIWSLADTAACKTPPPPPPSSGQQQPWLSCGGGSSGGAMGGAMAGMNVNGFAVPTAAMSPSPAAAPYSRYGGFFGGPYGGGGGGGGGAAAGGSGVGHAGAGFPEVQTDTPPQTPPNMKLPSVAANLNCFGNQHPGGQGPSLGYNGPPGPQQQQPSQHYMPSTSPGANFRLQQHQQIQHQHQQMQQMQPQLPQQPQMQEMSPVKERSPMNSGDEGAVSPYSQQQMVNGGGGSAQSPADNTAFKPFYKSSPTMGGGFVSPV